MSLERHTAFESLVGTSSRSLNSTRRPIPSIISTLTVFAVRTVGPWSTSSFARDPVMATRPYNLALERTAGSRALAAAAQRER